MAVFTVIAPKPNPQIEPKLVEKFPGEHIKISEGVWLVSGSGIAKDISDKLGFSDSSTGEGIVFATAGYFGYASNAIWEWIALKLKSFTPHASD